MSSFDSSNQSIGLVLSGKCNSRAPNGPPEDAPFQHAGTRWVNTGPAAASTGIALVRRHDGIDFHSASRQSTHPGHNRADGDDNGEVAVGIICLETKGSFRKGRTHARFSVLRYHVHSPPFRYRFRLCLQFGQLSISSALGEKAFTRSPAWCP